MSAVRPALAFASALLLYACPGPDKAQATSLDDAVDRYRRAEGPQKESELQTVADLPCAAVEVCEAKEVCLAAMRPTTRALGLKDEVARTLGDLQGKRLPLDAEAAQSLPAKLDEATTLLQEGRGKMAECERKLADLRLHYGH
jgi:hypothetical protein